MSENRPWHHLFGLSWMDFFHGTTVKVDEEVDLSQRKQLLDLAIVRADDQMPQRPPPDGFEAFARHNLVTFKSYQEALNGWALIELIGHYGNYRKQVSPSMREDDLLPEADFRLFAVCVRFPRNLVHAERVALTRVSEGVYDYRAITKLIRIVVIHELPQTPNNAMLMLFSAEAEQRAYGANHFQQQSPQTSRLLSHFVNRYREEKLPMPETLEEANRRLEAEIIQRATPEKILQVVPPEKLLAEMTSEQLLASLPPERRAELKRLLDQQPPIDPK